MSSISEKINENEYILNKSLVKLVKTIISGKNVLYRNANDTLSR